MQMIPARMRSFAPRTPLGLARVMARPEALVPSNFPRECTQEELAEHDITRYQVTKFYDNQIRKSGCYEQLKHIVEPSVKEFTSPGMLDTSGEHDRTVLPGLQHKYPQTGLLLVTDRCASYCRYCFRKRIVGKDSDEVAPDFAEVGRYIAGHREMNNVLLSGGDPF